MSKPRILWVSDGVAHTGFARVAHSVLEHLREDFDVGMLAAHHQGDPHDYPYPIWPAGSPTEPFGYGRLDYVAKQFKPDVVLILNDTYYVAKFTELREKLNRISAVPWKLIGYMPMDGPNLHANIAKDLSRLDAAIFYTHFGLSEASRAGFNGSATVIPHGIDRALFRRVPRETARKDLGLNAGDFIVGSVGRNQPRKRLDLTLAFFADWVEREQLPPNVKLYLHCAVKDAHINGVEELAGYFGIRDRLILTGKDVRWDKGVDDAKLSLIYSAMDLKVSSTLGEGWDCTTMEAMSCGTPNMVPEWSGLAEWARGAVEYVPCSEIQVFSGLENRIGGVPDREAFIAGLSRLYRSPGRRRELTDAGLELVSRPEFEWPNIAKAFGGVINAVLANKDTPQEAAA